MSILLVPSTCRPPENLPPGTRMLLWPVQVSRDSALLPSAGAHEVVTASEVFSSLSALDQEAYRLSSELVRAAPLFQGTNLLLALEAPIATGLLMAVAHQMIFTHIKDSLKSDDVVMVDKGAQEGFTGLLKRMTEHGLKVKVLQGAIPSELPSATGRRLARIRAELWDGWLNTAAVLLERLDRSFALSPYIGKALMPRTPGPFKSLGTLAFSSAEVYSKTLLRFQSHIEAVEGQDMCCIVTGAAPARPLARAKRPFAYWWQYARGLRFPEDEIKAHIKEVASYLEGSRAGPMLKETGVLKATLRRDLPFVARMSMIIKKILDETRPQRVVVSNQGSAHEAILLDEAARRSMHSVQLQHGVFGADYMEFQPVRSDELWVRGKFWKDFLPKSSQDKAFVKPLAKNNEVSDGEVSDKSSGPAARDTVLFLTAPYDDYPFKNLGETREILLRAFKAARGLGLKFVVRVHPREKTAQYTGWLGTESQQHCSVTQGEPLEPQLLEACMAVTYCSTVFEQCIRHRVPIVSFGWHHFRFKENIEQEGVFNFAKDLEDLERLMQDVHEDRDRYSRALEGKYRLFSD